MARQTARILPHHGFETDNLDQFSADSDAGKAKVIRFTTLEAICNGLDCQPGDILEYKENEKNITIR